MYGQANKNVRSNVRAGGWVEFFTYTATLSLTAGSGANFQQGSFRIDSDADFEFQKQCFHATSGFIRVRYRDESLGRYLSKNNPDLRSIASEFAGTPFIWPRPYLILAGTNFTVEAADNSGAANTLRLVLLGGKRRPGLSPMDYRYRAVLPFVYSTNPVSISANGTSYYNIEIDNDAHFLVQKITGIKVGDALLEFREQSTDRIWQNSAVPFDTIVGNGQFPHILAPYSMRMVPRGSVITVQFQDLSGAANNVEVNLIGVKLYE